VATRYRRRRSRRRGWSRAKFYLSFIVAIVLLAILGVIGFNLKVLENLDLSRTPIVAPDRFHGSEGIDIPVGDSPKFWWTRIDTGTVVRLPSDIQGVTTSGQFTRMIIPADVLFALDSSDLNDAVLSSVDEIAATVSDSTSKVIVVCHSSSDGSVNSRLELSERRADSLAARLEQVMNRPNDSIDRIGMGDTSPLPNIDQATPTGRALNRRCDVYLEAG